MHVLSRAVSGARSEGRPPNGTVTAISICGSMAAHWIASTTRLRELSRNCGPRSSPTAAVIDSQNVKSPKKGRRVDPHGYDAGKKIKGKKRHMSRRYDRPVASRPSSIPADIQDRDGGVSSCEHCSEKFPFCKGSS